MFRILLLFMMLLVSGVVNAEEPAALPFHLPIPEGWNTETIPFPLNFAPEIDYQGLEELRFAPGMFDSTAVDFWSYAFVWWVDDMEPAHPDSLAAELVQYYEGLSRAVGPGRGFDPDEAHFSATLYDRMEGMKEDGTMVGKIRTMDAFVTGRDLILWVDLREIPCPEQERRAIIVMVSPQPKTHPIWDSLRGIAAGFACGTAE